ncbi:MAG: hypothetical protein V1789_04275 [PVC group bacterium]
MYAERYIGPDEDPIYQKILNWQPEGEGEGGLYRRLYYRSYFDNLAWRDDSLSMLGFDIKPLDPRFQEIVEELTEGFPYELKVRKWGSRFWLNMSARYFLSSARLNYPHLEYRKMINGDFGCEAIGALPRIYFQDRWRPAAEEEQREALLNSDLRSIGWCDPETWAARPSPDSYPVPRDGNEADGEENFLRLQEKNRVTALDLSNPNRVVIDAESSTPAMLVMTDVYHPDWRATLNGEPVPVHRVNYLQRGIWCPPGECRIEMAFRPSSIGPGLAMTGAGLLALLGLIRLSFRSRRRQ